MLALSQEEGLINEELEMGPLLDIHEQFGLSLSKQRAVGLFGSYHHNNLNVSQAINLSELHFSCIINIFWKLSITFFSVLIQIKYDCSNVRI